MKIIKQETIDGKEVTVTEYTEDKHILEQIFSFPPAEPITITCVAGKHMNWTQFKDKMPIEGSRLLICGIIKTDPLERPGTNYMFMEFINYEDGLLKSDDDGQEWYEPYPDTYWMYQRDVPAPYPEDYWTNDGMDKI